MQPLDVRKDWVLLLQWIVCMLTQLVALIYWLALLFRLAAKCPIPSTLCVRLVSQSAVVVYNVVSLDVVYEVVSVCSKLLHISTSQHTTTMRDFEACILDGVVSVEDTLVFGVSKDTLRILDLCLRRHCRRWEQVSLCLLLLSCP